jgi:mRNA-degrading endonuclease RelE of RelBE toxin-antitoxin system
MKGLTFVAIGEISPEAKEKLKRLETKRKERLEKLVEDYKKNEQTTLK